jgi:hypothetical protein
MLHAEQILSHQSPTMEKLLKNIQAMSSRLSAYSSWDQLLLMYTSTHRGERKQSKEIPSWVYGGFIDLAKRWPLEDSLTNDDIKSIIDYILKGFDIYDPDARKLSDIFREKLNKYPLFKEVYHKLNYILSSTPKAM